MDTDIEDFVYTVKESADLLKLSERSIRRYISQGKLKAYRVAGERQLRIKGQDLLQLLEPVENFAEDDHPTMGSPNEEAGSPSREQPSLNRVARSDAEPKAQL